VRFASISHLSPPLEKAAPAGSHPGYHQECSAGPQTRVRRATPLCQRAPWCCVRIVLCITASLNLPVLKNSRCGGALRVAGLIVRFDRLSEDGKLCSFDA
jgi:hypothetical protein